MFLSVESLDLFYEDAIALCSENKLYKSLAYVCSTHEDFVPPLTNLLNEVRQAQLNGHAQAQETYYMMLKDYIVKLLGSCYINGTPFVDSKSLMKKSLSNWLMCKETFTFLAHNQVPTYRQDYFHFIEELVYLLSSQPQLEDYIHSELKHITLEEFHDKDVAELFIKVSSVITLEPQEIALVVKYSDKELLAKYLPKCLEFYRHYFDQLSQLEGIEQFYSQNKQLHYFHLLLQANRQQADKPQLLSQVNLQDEDYQLNGDLTRYLFREMSSEDILWDLEELLKIHSENTMVFTLEKFSLEVVDQKLMAMKDPTYRYLIVRKLLKKLRKEGRGERGDKIRKYHKKKHNSYNPLSSGGSSLRRKETRLIVDSESDTESVATLNELEREPQAVRRLGKEVMTFYVECLCRYKKEKRVYYELVCNM
jgi:CYTH domain-containing protein